jgi:hypothetical protein
VGVFVLNQAYIILSPLVYKKLEDKRFKIQLWVI